MDKDQKAGEAGREGKVPRSWQYTPNLFIHENHPDRELTPRKGWQQEVSRLTAYLDEEREKYRQLEIKSIEEKQELERQIVQLHSQLTEEQQTVKGLEAKAAYEDKLKDE